MYEYSSHLAETTQEATSPTDFIEQATTSLESQGYTDVEVSEVDDGDIRCNYRDTRGFDTSETWTRV